MWDHDSILPDTKDRYKKIYLSPNIKTALLYAGNYGEFQRLYIKNLFQGFHGDIRDIPWNDPNLIKQDLRKIIMDYKFDVKPEELHLFFHFYDMYCKNIKQPTEKEKAIVVVPSTISDYQETIERARKDTFYRISYEDILAAFAYGEFVVKGNIPPEKIMTISMNKDDSLSLNIGKKKVKDKLYQK